MSKRELYERDKNTKIHSYKIRFSREEKQLLDVKQQQYGYKHLSDYIRDASIYENVIVINVSYTEKVTDLFQTLIDEVRKFTKEVRRVMKYDTSASDEEREMIQQGLYRVYSSTKSLKNSVNDAIIQKINSQLKNSVNDNLNIEAIKKQSKERLYNQELNELEKVFNEITTDKT